MVEDIYLYRIKLPRGCHEAVLTCNGGYTVYIDEDLDDAEALKAYHHAVRHIIRGDCEFNGGNVQIIEGETHNEYHWANAR